jgi:hypothetical protein
MDIESKETLDAVVDGAAKKLRDTGESLIASFFGNLGLFVDATIPKIDAFIGRTMNTLDKTVDKQLSKVKLGVIK